MAAHHQPPAMANENKNVSTYNDNNDDRQNREK